MRLDAAPLGMDKVLRKSGALSGLDWFCPGHRLLAWGISRRFASWLPSLRRGPSPWEGSALFTPVPHGNAGCMREQIWKHTPYARFQSALIDMDSLVIAYDTAMA